MHESVTKLAENWTATGEEHRYTDDTVSMWESDEYPLILIVEREEGLMDDNYRTTFRVSGDHDEHAHKVLFKTPILESEEAANAMAAAIAAQPMNYARKFFN